MHAFALYFVINVLVHYTDEILHVLYVCTVCVLLVLHVHVYNVIVCVVEWVCVLGLSYHSVSLIHYTIMIVPLSGLTHLTPTHYLYIVISLALC